ncbi:YgiT-type zinc finger protein [Domibacillus robiginosus]|uniref:YgiT-type zinc finger protein n=1 Tax=Domibacillus robiginosus TaxID=1071054 RepID=UPI0012E05D7E
MLASCNYCHQGVLLPSLDMSSLYYQGKILFIHNVPYGHCTHCRNREYNSLQESKKVAQQAYEQYGITSIDFIQSAQTK